MQVHLSRSDIEILNQQALECIDLGDEGESFAEEAVSRFSEDDILVFEEVGEVDPHEFFLDVYRTWEGADEDEILETIASMLEDLDIELTYDALEDEEIDLDDDDWEEEIVEDDEEEDEEFVF